MQLTFGDYGLRWLVIIGLILIAAIGLLASGIRLDLASLAKELRSFGSFLLILPFFWAFGRVLPAYAHVTKIPVDFALSALQLFIAVKVFLPLSYIAAWLGSAFPLIDAPLKHFDLIFYGFDSKVYAEWIEAHARIEHLFAIVYFSIIGQSTVLLLLGSLLRTGERNGEFIWIFLSSAFLTCLIFIFTPALGLPGYIGKDHIDALEQIRSGGWTMFSFDRAEGIVTFPSFHTTLAVVFTYVAARMHRWAFRIFAALNGLMLFAIPPMGGHYLIDMWGGAAVACIPIILARTLCPRLQPSLRIRLGSAEMIKSSDLRV